MTEAILLGNVAMRAGGKFTWDAKNMKTDRPDTDKLISKVYRGGWEVDQPDLVLVQFSGYDYPPSLRVFLRAQTHEEILRN